MFDLKDLYDGVVVPVLGRLAEVNHNLDSPKARRLLLGTAAVESGYLELMQDLNSGNHGPANSFWQLEKATVEDHARWLSSNSRLALYNAVDDFACTGYEVADWHKQIRGNLYLACALARIHYWRRPEPLPESLLGQAEYWKQWYNTRLGAGTPKKYLQAWGAIVVPWKSRLEGIDD